MGAKASSQTLLEYGWRIMLLTINSGTPYTLHFIQRKISWNGKAEKTIA